MKLINIFPILSLLFVLLSCSSENEILDDLSHTNSIGEDVYVVANIGSNNEITKSTIGSSDPGEDLPGDPISRFVLFLLDKDNKVIGLTHKVYTTINDKGEEEIKPVGKAEVKLLTKVGLAKKAIAVVDFSSELQLELLKCNNYSEIKSLRETDAYSRVKVGEVAIDWKGFEGSPNTDIDNVGYPIKDLAITVVPRTACVDLISFNVNYKGAGIKKEVKLTEIWFENMKQTVGLLGDEGNNDESNFFNDEKNILGSNDGIVAGTELNHTNCFFKSVFPNTNSNKPVKMHIKFTVGGENSDKYERVYIVNRPIDATSSTSGNKGFEYVRAGYWYRLSVTVNVDAEMIDCDINCTILDWQKNIIDLGDIVAGK